MLLHHDMKRIQMERLIQDFGSATGDSTIHKRAVQKGGGYYHGYVARQWVCLEPCRYFISRNDRHNEIQEDQIGSDRACLL